MSKLTSGQLSVLHRAVHKYAQMHADQIHAACADNTYMAKVAQAWYDTAQPASNQYLLNSDGGAPPMPAEGMGQAPPNPNAPIEEIGQGSDNSNLANEVFGTQMVNPVGAEMQGSIQQLIMNMKDLVVNIAKSVLNIDLSEEDALKIVKGALPGIVSDISKVPLEPAMKSLEKYNDANKGAKAGPEPKPENPMQTPEAPSMGAAPASTPTEEPLEPTAPSTPETPMLDTGAQPRTAQICKNIPPWNRK